MEKIKGISFSLLKIDASNFNGYGIRFLTIGWLTKGKRCLIGHDWRAFSLYLSKPTDESLRIGGEVLGLQWYKYLKPKLIQVCKTCGRVVNQDYGCEDNEYYCDECSTYIHESCTEVKPIYKD